MSLINQAQDHEMSIVEQAWTLPLDSHPHTKTRKRDHESDNAIDSNTTNCGVVNEGFENETIQPKSAKSQTIVGNDAGKRHNLHQQYIGWMTVVFIYLFVNDVLVLVNLGCPLLKQFCQIELGDTHCKQFFARISKMFHINYRKR